MAKACPAKKTTSASKQNATLPQPPGVRPWEPSLELAGIQAAGLPGPPFVIITEASLGF